MTDSRRSQIRLLCYFKAYHGLKIFPRRPARMTGYCGALLWRKRGIYDNHDSKSGRLCNTSRSSPPCLDSAFFSTCLLITSSISCLAQFPWISSSENNNLVPRNQRKAHTAFKSFLRSLRDQSHSKGMRVFHMRFCRRPERAKRQGSGRGGGCGGGGVGR